MLNLRFLQFSILSLAFAHTAFATQPAIPVASLADLKNGSLLLGPYVRIFEDKQGTARWEDVLAGKHDADFKPQNKAVPNFGSTRSVIWAVVDLDLRRGDPSGRTSQPPRLSESGSEEYLLELSHPVLDFVDVVVQNLASKKVLHRWETGDLRPFASRPINHRNFLFPIEAETARFWVRLNSESSMLLPLKIWHPRRFAEVDGLENLFIGAYYGIILIMIVYNLLVSMASKSLSGYFYVGFIAMLLVVQCSLDGNLIYAFPNFRYFNNLGVTFFGAISMAFGLLFSVQYLRMKHAYPRFFKFLLFMGFLGLLPMVISLIFGYRAAVRLQFFMGVLGPVVVIAAGILRILNGYKPARYFVAGYGTMMTGTIIFTLARSGVIASDNFFLYHSMQIGSALEAILLSFGLADRIRLIQKEKELAQAATIEQQRILNEAFARFVPAPFLQILGKKSIPEVLLGDYTEREMTILFADIRGFTTISEKLSPKQTFDFINNYLQGSGPVIRNNGGFIDKYMGDGIMALFGKREDAIKAALRLQDRNARLNKSLGTRLVAPLNVGIGIHTGHLMLGTIGEPQRMDGTVISDAVNLASRVESLTKQYGVGLLVTKETLAGMPLGTAEFPWIRRFIDRIAVKGKSEPATIYELIALKNGRATKYSKKWLLAWNEAMRLYYARQFSGAIRVIDQLLKKSPEDMTALLFKRRSEEYALKPPAAEWNGIAVARSK